MLIDTHCHLSFEAFNRDYKRVAEKAKEKGMKLVTVGAQLETSRKAVQIAQEYDHIFASVGLHPTHLTDEEFAENEYLTLAGEGKTAAIGETGLDYYHFWADTPQEGCRPKRIAF